MEITIVSTKNITPIHLCVGDTLNVKYTDSNGERSLHHFDIDTSLIADKVSFAKLSDGLGFNNALMAIIGDSSFVE